MRFLYPALVMIMVLLVGEIPAAQLVRSPDQSFAGADPHRIRESTGERVVTLVTLEWPPYVGQNLPESGYVHELVVTALDRAGYKARVKFVPWARAIREVRYGEADAIFPEYYSESRNQHLAFSDPFPGGPVGFYKRSDSPIEYQVDPRANPMAAFKDLQEYTIGVVRDYVNTPVFDRADFLKKDPAVNDTNNLRRLYYHRVDLIVIDKFVADYLLNTQLKAYRDELEFMPPPLEIKYLYVAFSRKDPEYQEKLEAFNRGLASIKADGTLQRIYEKHGAGVVLEYEKELAQTGIQENGAVD